MSSKSKAPKNISVFVRVRPPVPREKDHTFNNITYNPVDDRVISILKPNASKPTPAKEYVFNRVFKPSSTQKEVYEDFGKNAVDAAFSGEHGVLFVYGQTGSGKTHTISNDDPQDPGVLQQALTEVWNRVQKESKNYDFICSVSYVQLYNEILTNLLDEKRGRVRIQLGPEGAGDVVLLSETSGSSIEVAVRSYEDAMNLFRSGMKRKEMTSTAMNATSSRSHTIFTFNILKSTRNGPQKLPIGGATDPISKDDDAKSSSLGNDVLDSARGGGKTARGSAGGTTARGGAAAPGSNYEPDREGPSKMALEGRLVLCDLAGSERISKTQAQGKALDEATHINGSLLVLGKVVAALIEKKSQHAPFRESKLTRILQYSLLGNGNTSMVVNVSPSDDNTDETISAMFFGQRASQIKQDAKRHEILDYKALYLQLLADIDMKRDNLLTHVVDEEAALYDSRIEELEQELGMCKLEIATLRKENEVAKGGISTEQLRVLYYDSGVEWKAMAKKIRGMYDALNDRHKTLSTQHQKVALMCAESETQLFELGKRTQHMRLQYSVDFARFCSRIDELTKQLSAAKGTEYISSEGDLAGASSPNWNTPQFPTIMSEESVANRLPTAVTPREGEMFGVSNALPLEMQLVKEREQMSAIRKDMMEMRLYQRKSVQAIRFLAAENEAISSEVGKPCLYTKLISTPSMTPSEERPRLSTGRSSKSRK